MKDIEQFGKIDHSTLHLLPFVPSRKRKMGYVLTRTFGDTKMTITAKETLNAYDLMTLLYIVKEYTVNGYKGGYLGDTEVAGIDIDTKKFLLSRNILNKKPNKETLKNSLKRLKTIDIEFHRKKEKETIYTSYIYEIAVKDDLSKFRIFANKTFIDLVAENGILINLKRLNTYGSKDQYSILLDLYLQGTKIPIKIKNQKRYVYREKFTFTEIEQTLKLDMTNMRHSDKLEIMRNTFTTLYNKGNMPEYQYNNIEEKWQKKAKNEGKLQP